MRPRQRLKSAPDNIATQELHESCVSKRIGRPRRYYRAPLEDALLMAEPLKFFAQAPDFTSRCQTKCVANRAASVIQAARFKQA